jgi:exosortase C (VPDSG-CTERM-specific)
MPPDSSEKLTASPRPDLGQPAPAAPPPASADDARQWRHFGWATFGLGLAFALPLGQLIRFAAASKLYSYILLIPFISGYLFWPGRHKLWSGVPSCSGLPAVFLTSGAGVLLAYWLGLRSHFKLLEDDYLAVMTVACLLFFLGVCGRFFGTGFLRANAFPLGFLFFMVPLPVAVLSEIDTLLQYSSAGVAREFFTLAGTPFLQDGLVFQLPGITIRIAPECSGIHSSIVLFITSLLASYMLLRTPWKRAVFILAVIPLGILRNGFRVFTIGELCVHISPRMIDSPIHHRGGPVFFVLSLIPLFILLIILLKSERAGPASKNRAGVNPD